MAYVEPPTFTSSTTATAADANILSEDIRYLKTQVDGFAASAVQLTRSAATSVPNSTSTAISWSAETLDLGGWWSSGTNIVVPAGAIPTGATTILVQVNASTVFTSNGTGNRRISLLKNGSVFKTISISAVSGDSTDVDVSGVTTVAAADVLTVERMQGSGGALNASQAEVTVIRMGIAS